MGTFMGHVLPGSFFAAFAIYWAIRLFRRLLRPDGAASFRSSASSGACRCCVFCKPYNYEAILKLVAIMIGITAEIVTAFENGKFKHLGNIQHATMFVAFGLTAVVDLLIHHKVSFVVEGTDYAATALALAVEAILFTFHVHGMSSLEIHVHKILNLVIMANIAAVLAEMRYRRSALAACARIYFFLLQGTWFWQIAFTLYSPLAAEPWDGEDHENLMMATMYFTWHILGGLIGMIGIAAATASRLKCQPLSADEYLVIKVNAATEDGAHGAAHLLDVEQDSDNCIEN